MKLWNFAKKNFHQKPYTGQTPWWRNGNNTIGFNAHWQRRKPSNYRKRNNFIWKKLLNPLLFNYLATEKDTSDWVIKKVQKRSLFSFSILNTFLKYSFPFYWMLIYIFKEKNRNTMSVPSKVKKRVELYVKSNSSLFCF